MIEFTSTRKRMTVVVKTPEDKVKIFMKGADSIVQPLLVDDCPNVSQTFQYLEDFAKEGLRTLMIASKEISNEEYQQWNHVYQKALVSLTNREELLEQAARMIEKDMELVGATAIEDKLQD